MLLTRKLITCIPRDPFLGGALQVDTSKWSPLFGQVHGPPYKVPLLLVLFLVLRAGSYSWDSIQPIMDAVDHGSGYKWMDHLVQL